MLHRHVRCVHHGGVPAHQQRAVSHLCYCRRRCCAPAAAAAAAGAFLCVRRVV